MGTGRHLGKRGEGRVFPESLSRAFGATRHLAQYAVGVTAAGGAGARRIDLRLRRSRAPGGTGLDPGAARESRREGGARLGAPAIAYAPAFAPRFGPLDQI